MSEVPFTDLGKCTASGERNDAVDSKRFKIEATLGNLFFQPAKFRFVFFFQPEKMSKLCFRKMFI